MTFEEFQATKREVDELGSVKSLNDLCVTGPGLIYQDDLFIEIYLGQYYLTIENCQWSTATGELKLEDLERELYDWSGLGGQGG